MRKRLLSVFLTLVMLVSMLPVSVFAQTVDADLGSVRVIVENNAQISPGVNGVWKDGTEPWKGKRVDTVVPLKADSTMASCIHDADETTVGWEGPGAFISEIGGLAAPEGIYSCGWLISINDWFANESAGAFSVAKGTLKDGDEIRVQYTVNSGKDVGSIEKDTTKTLTAVDITGGQLSGTFAANKKNYEIALGAGVTDGQLSLVPAAYNKNFQVRIYKGANYDPMEQGYRRGEKISVHVGDTIKVVVGDPAWPSMNNGEYGGADKVPAVVYTFKIVEAAAPAPSVDSFFKNLAGVAEVKNDAEHPMVPTEDGEALVSTNAGIDNSTSGVTLTFQKAARLSFSYKTSSEEYGDFLRISQNGTILNGGYKEPKKSDFFGNMADYKTFSLQVNSGDVVTLEYYKDVGSAKYQDCAWMKDFAVEMPYAVTFHANDGTPATKEQGIFGTAALEANTFTYAGHRFAGWAESEKGPVVYGDGDKITLSANKDLYAVWTPVWTVTFPQMPEGAVITVKQGTQVIDPESDGSYLLPDGAYTYSASLFGYTPAVDVAFTVHGAALPIAQGLTKLPSYKVRFRITPEEAAKAAEVTLLSSDGTVMTADSEGSYDLPKGEYTYTVKAPGFKKVSGKITVDNLYVVEPVVMEVSHVWEGDIAAEAPQQVDGVYQIGTGAQLAWFAQHVNQGEKISAQLTADLQLNAPEEAPVHLWTPIGTEAKPFAGSFNGAGFTISGLFITEGSQAGLFGVIAAEGTVSDVKLSGADVTGNTKIGLLAGENRGIVSGVSAAASAVNGIGYVGGIVGSNAGTVTACANESAVVTQKTAKDFGIGGVVGMNDGTVSLSYNKADLVRGHGSSSYAYFGGVVGYNNKGTIDSCYNTGKVPMAYKAGGIAGHVGYSNTISNCYNAGTVDKGGSRAIRDGISGTMENCFYLETCGASDVKAAKMTEQQLKEAAAQLGGAFRSDLEPPVNGGFPILKWQDPQAAYSITLTVTPADAVVTMEKEGQSVPAASVQEGVYRFTELQPGTYTYTVAQEAKDYAPQSGTITLGKADVEKSVALEVRVYPVTVTMTPSDAVLTVKNQEGQVMEGTADAGTVRYQLPNGQYTYTAEKFGYTVKTGIINVQKAAVTENVTLETSQSHTLTLTGLPADASVQLTHPVGGTMTSDEQGIYHLVDGVYTYQVTCPGYANLKGTLTMKGSDQNAALPMVQLSAWDGTVAEGFAVGQGSAEDPYQISSPAELAYLSQISNGADSKDYQNKVYRVVNDLDLGGVNAFTPISSAKSKNFEGTFDGSGKVISNLYVEAAGGSAGLFGNTSGSTIRSVVLKAPVISATGNDVGSLIGYANNGRVENCAVLGAAVAGDSSDNVGGLIGSISGTTVHDSYVIGDVGGKSSVGGLFGNEQSGSVSNCFVRGTVSGSGSFVGGLVGKNGNMDDYWDGTTGTYQGIYTDVIVAGSGHYGTVFGYFDPAANTLSSVYYNSEAGCTGNGEATDDAALVGKTMAQLKSDDMVALLNGDGQAYARRQDESGYVNDGLPYLKDTYFEAVALEKLPAPTNLAWNGKTLTWSAVEHAAGYRVILYKNDAEAAQAESNVASLDLAAQIGLGGSGSYTAAVQAIGDGEKYGTSQLSQKSAAAEFSVDGAEVTFHVTPAEGSFGAGDPKITVQVGEVTWELSNDTAKFLPTGTHTYTVTADTFQTATGTVTVEKTAKTVEVVLAFDPVWNGTMTKEPALVNEVYQISNGYELAWFRDRVNESTDAGKSSKLNAVLTADIDLGGHDWTPISRFGTTSNTYGYIGTFDGAGHRVDGLHIDGDGKGNALFGYVYTHGTVKGVTVAGSVSGSQYAAGVVALLAGGRVENCVNEAAVGGNPCRMSGGVVGYMTNYDHKTSAVVDCINRGAVTGGGTLGGVVGSASNGTEVSRCRNEGAVSGSDMVGGIVGSASLNVQGCSNHGSVTGTASKVGGIAGHTSAALSECYNTGAVSGVSDGGKRPSGVGGIVGNFYNGKAEVMITGAYNAGTVKDSGAGNVGAVIGSKKAESGVSMDRCYYLKGSCDKDVGINATEGDSAQAVTQEQLRSKAMAGLLGGSFAAPATGGAPVLRWEDPTAQIVTAFVVTPEDAVVEVTKSGETAKIPAAEPHAWVLPDGTYAYSITKNKYDTVTGEITVAGKSQTIRAALHEQTYPVTFTVTPVDATVTVKENGVVVLPGENGYQLGAGTYTYTVEKFGYLPKSGSFTVKNQAVEVPPITLEQAAAYDVTLQITYEGENPADTAITVRCGEEVVGTGASLHLPDGEYTYKIVAGGYFNGEGSFRVEGAAVQVPVAMKLRTTWDGTTVKEPTLSEGVYQITSAEELAWFARQVNEGQTAIRGKVMTDLFINDEMSRNQWTPIGDFTNQYSGTFDGNGKTIHGLNAPLFGYGGKESLITGVTVDGTIQGHSNVGGICTATYGGIENCINNADIRADGQRVGGIVGVVYSEGHITQCANYGAVTSSYRGSAYTESGSVYLGGITGYAYGPVLRCANSGAISATEENYGGVGGICGVAQNTVENSYNVGAVSGCKRTGGLVGIADVQGAVIKGGYNAGEITCTGSSPNPFCGAVAGDVANSEGGTVGIVSGTYYRQNSYQYQNHNEGIGYGSGEATAKEEAAMKSEAFARMLGSAFHVDDPMTQHGYPLLAWQGGRAPEASADEKAVAADKLALEVSPTTVTQAMTLPLAKKGEHGSSITWSSSQSDIISDEGVVTLPKSGTAQVELTATITKGTASDTRIFTIRVQSAEVTAQNVLNEVTAAMGTVHLKPVYGSDRNITDVFAAVMEQKMEVAGIQVPASDITVELIHTGSNNIDTDPVQHIAADGAITYYYVDPAADTLHGAPMKDIQFRLTYQGAQVECTASAFIPWDRGRVRQEMNKIADALTFDVIKGENTDAGAVQSDLALPSVLDEYSWATVAWTSSNGQVIRVQPGSTTLDPSVGKIYPASEDTQVKLTAVVTFNKTSAGEPMITLRKELPVTVTGAASVVDETLQAALDRYTMDQLKDFKTGTVIDPTAVTGDISLLKPKDLKIDGREYKVSVEAGTEDVVINGYRANVYRPLPGAESVRVPLRVTITHKETGRALSKELGTVIVLPLEQSAIDAEIALMEQVKEYFFDGVAGENTDPMQISTDLHPFQEVYEKDGQLVWVYHYQDRTDTGIIPTSIPKDHYDETYDRFHSSHPNIIRHENLLLVSAPQENTTVTITACLASQDFARYAERYPDNADLQKLTGQMVYLDVVVLGTSDDQKAANETMALIRAIGPVSLDSEPAIAKARASYDALTEKQQEMVSNYRDLLQAERELEVLKSPKSDVENIYQTTGALLEQMAQDHVPEVGSVGGEWLALGLYRSGRSVPAGYYDNVVAYVKEHCNDKGQVSHVSTDNSRLILALTAGGKDVTNVGGHNLLDGLREMKFVKRQGINGAIWALLALDSAGYEIPAAPTGAEQTTREKLVGAILAAQLPDGGWDLHHDAQVSDVDLTAMALQALAPYVSSNADVREAVDRAVAMLSARQGASGGYGSVTGISTESSAQVILALTALGIDPHMDLRFVKNGWSVVDALCRGALESGGFRHNVDGDYNQMSTEQAYEALTSYMRFVNHENHIFDMSDVTIEQAPDPKPDVTPGPEQGETPNGTPDPTPGENSGDSSSRPGTDAGSAPESGDTSRLAVYGGWMAAAYLAVALLMRTGKKNKEER